MAQTSLPSPKGAKIGTASLRRRAQLLRYCPDLAIVPIRGNVNTRLRKMESGEVEATVLALCGLERLGLSGRATEILPREIMLPAVGQGALAIECRAGDETARRLVEPLHDRVSAACVYAERAMLAALEGSCRTPIAGLAEVEGDRLTLEGLLLKPDGSSEIRGRLEGAIDDARGDRHRVGQRATWPRRSGFRALLTRYGFRPEGTTPLAGLGAQPVFRRQVALIDLRV